MVRLIGLQASLLGGQAMTEVEQQPIQEANGAATEQPKARSGYGRLRNRHHRLIEEHESLAAEFQVVRAELAEWRSMYVQLKADLDALTPGEASHG